MDNIDKFVQLVQESDNIVFFGGAGVSTESGIPDFRSPDGLYNQKYKYPPETIISHSFYQRYPEEFYRFYKDKMLYPDAKPGITHLALAKLEKEGNIFVLRPEMKPVSRLEKDYDKLMAFYDHGYEMMKRELPRLEAYLEM